MVSVAPQKPFQCQVLLLAAGLSKRFNAIKQLALVNDHDQQQPLVIHTLKNLNHAIKAIHANRKVYIATGLYHQQIDIALKQSKFPYQCLYCDQADLGMGHTIAQAVKSMLSEAPETTHIAITLADQVAITSEDYQRFFQQALHKEENIIASKTASGLSAPVVFPQQYFSALMALTGDKGAKSVLMANQANVRSFALDCARIDIDAPEDLTAWNQRH